MPILLLDAPDAPVVKMDTFLAGAVIEFFIVFAEGAHIAIDFVYFGIHVIAHQLCQLERVHAARPRAVLVIFIIPAATTMHDRHALGWLTIFEGHLSTGRAAGIDQTLELH